MQEAVSGIGTLSPSARQLQRQTQHVNSEAVLLEKSDKTIGQTFWLGINWLI